LLEAVERLWPVLRPQRPHCLEQGRHRDGIGIALACGGFDHLDRARPVGPGSAAVEKQHRVIENRRRVAALCKARERVLVNCCFGFHAWFQLMRP